MGYADNAVHLIVGNGVWEATARYGSTREEGEGVAFERHTFMDEVVSLLIAHPL